MELCSAQNYVLFFLGLLLRSLSTHVFFLVVLLCLVLSMTAFCFLLRALLLGTLLRSSFTRLSVLSDYVFLLFLVCVFYHFYRASSR